MRSRSCIAILSGLAGLAAATGCGLSVDGPQLIENRCTADSECPGAACDVRLGMCVSPTAAPLRIGLEVTPLADPGATTPTTFSFETFLVSGPTTRDLALPTSITVGGDVRAPAYGDVVRATVRFIRSGAFSGARRLEVATTTSATPTIALDGLTMDYSIHVAAGDDYAILVEPSGEWAERLPPLRLTRGVPSGGDFVRIDLPYPDELPVLNGLIVSAAEEPVSGLVVRAVDRASGRVVSSAATTGREPLNAGEFTLVLDPDATDYVIRISGGDDQRDFPTLLADPAYLYPDDRGHVRILVPMLSPVRYRGFVEYEDGQPAAGAALELRAVAIFDETTGFTGTFRVAATAGDDGFFEASLVPGTYDVIVTPPTDRGPSAAHGVLHQVGLHIDAPADGSGVVMGQLFSLPERATLSGVVRTPDERVMGGATVTASALGIVPEGAVSAARYNRTSDTTTDHLGQINLPLDLGVYDLYVRPPLESRFPWIVRPNYAVGSPDVFSDVFEVTAPIPLHGTVSMHDGGGAATAEVRAYAIVRDAMGSERAVLVGTASTGPDGAFMLLLPARL